MLLLTAVSEHDLQFIYKVLVFQGDRPEWSRLLVGWRGGGGAEGRQD